MDMKSKHDPHSPFSAVLRTNPQKVFVRVRSLSDIISTAMSSTDLSEYNIVGSISGLGEAINLEIVHFMFDTLDVREFVALTHATSHLLKHPHLPWALTSVISTHLCSLLLPHNMTPTV